MEFLGNINIFVSYWHDLILDLIWLKCTLATPIVSNENLPNLPGFRKNSKARVCRKNMDKLPL